MDPDMRAHLDAMEQRAVARDAATRREARVMHEALLREIRALGEGLTSQQSAPIERMVTAQRQSPLDERIAPLARERREP